MTFWPYLVFDGNCEEAVHLYKEAFQTKTQDLLHFSDLPEDPGRTVPESFQKRILYCTLQLGEGFLRMSDCGPGGMLRIAESERMSVAVETDIYAVRHAFEMLAKDGHIKMPLTETFYSPLTGVVFDQFGVLWHFYAAAAARPFRIDAPEKSLKGVKVRHRWSKTVSNTEFYIDTRESRATVIWQKRGELRILRGARMKPLPLLNKDGTLGLSAKMGDRLRQDHQDKIRDFTTTGDIVLKSVNEVGLFLYFAGTNSWLELKDGNGKTLDEWSRTD